MAKEPLDVGQLSGDIVNAATNWVKEHPRMVVFMVLSFFLGVLVGRCR